MAEIRTKSKSGVELTLDVSGFAQEPKIQIIEPRTVQGRTIAGPVTLGKACGATEAGFFCRNQVFIQGAEAVEQVRVAISELPKKIYRIYLGKEIINADGDMIEVPQWTHENGGVRGANQSEIVRMLESAHITDITVEDAEKMWNEQVAAERKPFIEAAQKAGKPVEYRRGLVECTDPREECSADIAITYMHADGSMHTEYTHTY